VHVEYLARELARLIDLEVHCFGQPRAVGTNPAVVAHPAWDRLAGREVHRAALGAMSVDLDMAADVGQADLVHSHTWYVNLAGHLAKLLYGIPHVATVHSLEPKRPWKAEQLGGGYKVSSFCERTGLESADAVIAVSHAVAEDIHDCYPDIRRSQIHVIHNGVEVIDYDPGEGTDLLDRHGIDSTNPVVLFVGRISRQKGIEHLLAACPFLPKRVQVVLRAGAADTPELDRHVGTLIENAAAAGHAVVWIREDLGRTELAQLFNRSTVFCCPSVYEPFGLVNLEAMACGLPVVASAVGGIPEVVADGRTGILVPLEPTGPGHSEPRDPEAFAVALAEALLRLVDDPAEARRMGDAGRQRVIDHFSWRVTAERTVALYQGLLS
jgi:starch synthase